MSLSFAVKSSWMEQFQWSLPPQQGSKLKGPKGFVFIVKPDDANLYQKLLSEHGQSWQKEQLKTPHRDLIYFQGKHGPVWILRGPTDDVAEEMGAFSQDSAYTKMREQMGGLVSHFKAHHLQHVLCKGFALTHESLRGLFIGLEMGAYTFLNSATSALPKLYFEFVQSPWSKTLVSQCQEEALAINQARHWVNLPPNFLNPTSFSQWIKKQKWGKGLSVEVWDLAKLRKENMNLLIAVGQGSTTPPAFVRIKYRPNGAKKFKPMAFVGKGITFDTGGLDIKPAAGMRLMKKDMGGAAAVLGLAQWVARTRYPRACDFYLCLAENSVDGMSFRPSDVITSRAGLKIEIDNTDAEGRLVLADGLDVAIRQSEKPEFVVDVATLTGAIKVALGADVAGLFANRDELGLSLYEAGLRVGDICWRMPLVRKYFSSLRSPYADFKNSSEGFGGAITAALFLQKFVETTAWAHLDIYAWIDKAQGPLEFGGSGQGVQLLIEFLKSKVKS